jgi:uncharacterized protein (DUF305 family)
MNFATYTRRCCAPAVFALVALAAAGKDYTPADARFMQMMIVHHAQAVVMSNWAPTHGARSDVAILCKRIALSQYDEIDLMQRWLLKRGLAAPRH